MDKSISFKGAEIKYAKLLDLILPDTLIQNGISDKIMATMEELYVMNDDERAEAKTQIERDLAIAAKNFKLRLAKTFRENIEEYSEEVSYYASNNEILNRLKPREKNNDNNGTEEVTTN